ncbi:Predicted arabinose efflux permease, MFS family [Devosia lucknowensis]|uniref:Predicted arabinose efflux permease, MFS family n=1 Tax=Devosia lucknowensis TaxID=1096929 RepID=A0A1Y6EX23_9HYPH|nr:MFS transporter [Devosia lucknowensis]SMQ65082.1 Predicted arabinose efflux permease, MFS family [Devosia lucknowensis]
MTLRGFLWRYYAYVFLFDFILAYAFYTALFELEGLSITEIGVLLALWSAAAIILEMPSGALSDHFDRRWLLMAAPLFKALTFLLWILAAGNFWLYTLGFMFWSLAQALQSGSREALLYERMAHDGREAEFDKALGRDNAAEELGIGCGTLLGGFVAWLSFDWGLWLSVPPLLMASALALGLEDVRRSTRSEQPTETVSGYFSHFVDAANEFRHHANLRFVATYIAVGLVVFQLLEEFDQLYYLAISLPIWAWGVAGAAVEFLFAGASLFAHRLDGRPWLAWLLPLVGGVLLVLASVGASPWFVLLLCAAYVVMAPINVLAEARFQRVMEGRSRATTTSALVMAENVSGIVLTLAFSLLAERVGILPAYGWAGLVMAPLALWVIYGQRRGLRATD